MLINLKYISNYGFVGFASSAAPTYQNVNYEFAQFANSAGFCSSSEFSMQSNWNKFDQL